jgi:hypothetical protein
MKYLIGRATVLLQGLIFSKVEVMAVSEDEQGVVFFEYRGDLILLVPPESRPLLIEGFPFETKVGTLQLTPSAPMSVAALAETGKVVAQLVFGRSTT